MKIENFVLLVILFFLNIEIFSQSNISFNEKEVKPKSVSILPNTISESSGLIFYNDLFWTFNDSGGKPEIYGIDEKSGKISTTVSLKNVDNVDWEDIAQDDKNIYIGDFGNNAGNRKDLCIYVISKKYFKKNNDCEVIAEKISFSYKNQTNFEVKKRNHSFDCESMFCRNDSIYILTKDWLNYNTCLYSMPAISGTYNLLPKSEYQIDMLVTGADISKDGKKIILIGYSNFKSFVWILTDFENNNFLESKKTKIKLLGFNDYQTEGICFYSDNLIYISCEKSAVDQQIFKFSIADLK